MEPIDVGDAVSGLSSAGAAIGTVAVAMIGVAVVALTWRYVKGFIWS